MRTALWIFLAFILRILERASLKWAGGSLLFTGTGSTASYILILLFVICFFACVYQDLLEMTKEEKP